MREQSHSTSLGPSLATEKAEKGEIVSIYVDYNHPLLQLKRALSREAIREVMVRRWRAAGKMWMANLGFPGMSRCMCLSWY
ncbi:MAG: hypothetical protein DDT27_01242 [Dehalococcoidia bacterium]|nr:hypothetical protein [Chloroflexota bacterium]